MKHLVNVSSQPQPAFHGLSRLLPRLTQWAGVALVLASFQPAFGFALLGPFNEAYQTPTVGYDLAPGQKIFGAGSIDIGAPKNFNQFYRRNTPVMYYALDNNFLTFFGSNGVSAVDAAFQVFNNLPPVSQMSADLSEYPLNTTRVNSTAEGLSLLDLKSAVLGVIVEQLGLAEPERYTWAMHDRVQLSTPCPALVEYLIVQRNFDPVTFLPTSYVNGTLYSYIIVDYCPVRALCVPVAVDADADTFTPVADATVNVGGLYMGLTRDDVGGLRYLLRTNSYAVEGISPDSVAIVTNTLQGQELVTSSLTELAQQAVLTNATSLEGLFPGLVITSSTNYPVRQWVTNITFLYFTNSPWQPVGTAPSIPVYSTNRTLTFPMHYEHTFANLITFSNTPNGWVTVPITSLSQQQGHAFVTLQTTTLSGTTSHTFLTNEAVGDYFILPTNSCGIQVLYPLLTNVYTVTNLLTGTNSLSVTNTVSTGNTNSTTSTNLVLFSQSLIEYHTNRMFWVYTADCTTNDTVLRQGIEKITFMSGRFDSLLNRYFYPITNQYTMMIVTNSMLMPQVIQRVITTPDFLFTADDMNAGLVTGEYSRSINFNTNGAAGTAPGPGTIDPGSTITFNSSTPVFYNMVNGSEATQSPGVIFGSFDMSTNPPVVYPSFLSLRDLENMILIQVTPPYLPDAPLNVPYSALVQTQGGTPNWEAPFSFALMPNSPPLPPGLMVNSDGSITGTPTTPGAYNFVVQVTDAQGRTYNRAYQITVQ